MQAAIKQSQGVREALRQEVITATEAFRSNPPPEGHWGAQFWDIGRAEGELQEELVKALRLVRKELDACQRVIHYAGGFDPAYVNDAQAAIKVADAVLEKIPG